MKTIRTFGVVASLIAMAFPAATFAGQTTGNITVSATVSANCSVTTNPLAFGTYDPIAANSTTGSDATTTANIGVTCTNGTNPTSVVVNSTAGTTQGSSSSMNTSPANTALNYTYSLTAPGGGFVSGSNTSNTYVLHGTIAKGQNVASGSYSDTLVASVNF